MRIAAGPQTPSASDAWPAQVHVAVATRKMPQGVRTFPEILALAQAVEACPSLHLRGVMTHGGDYDVRRHLRAVSLRMPHSPFQSGHRYSACNCKAGHCDPLYASSLALKCFLYYISSGCAILCRLSQTLCMNYAAGHRGSSPVSATAMLSAFSVHSQAVCSSQAYWTTSACMRNAFTRCCGSFGVCAGNWRGRPAHGKLVWGTKQNGTALVVSIAEAARARSASTHCCGGCAAWAWSGTWRTWPARGTCSRGASCTWAPCAWAPRCMASSASCPARGQPRAG